MAYKKIEQYDDKITSKLIEHYKGTLDLLGEDSEREGIIKTPERRGQSHAISYTGLPVGCKGNSQFCKIS